MAILDTSTSAGLLGYCKLMARRPSNDAELDDDDWYTLLTEAQKELYSLWSVHFPHVLWGAWTALTTSDNITYTIPGVTFPLGGVVIRHGVDGNFLKPATVADDDGDFTFTGATIVMSGNEARTFQNGLYAKFIADAGTIDASNEPSLIPAFARPLIAYKALVLWAHRGGGQRNPDYYSSLFQKAFTGDERIAGDVGILGAIHQQYFGAQGDPVPMTYVASRY